MLTGTLLVVGMLAVQTFAVFDYSVNPDGSKFVPYVGAYDASTYPQKNLNAVFTDDEIIVDGDMDAAYATAASSRISNLKTIGTYAYPAGEETYGDLRAVWDGPVMYLFVEVHDTTAVRGTLPETGGAMTSKPALPADRDSVVFALDFFNEKVVYETDTAGVFTISSNGILSYFHSANTYSDLYSIPTLSSVIADPTHPEYGNRIKSYAASDIYAANGTTVIGYNVEVAIQLQGTELINGTSLGVDVQISDTAVTTVDKPAVRVGNAFWSHNQDSIYTEYDHERPNCVDWGNVSLSGWNGTDEFAFSDWRLTNDLRWLDSIAFPKQVWTDASQAALDAAVRDARILAAAVIGGVRDKERVDEAADNLEAAINGLRWKDTRYPDPKELPDQFTLPNPYKFFNSDRVVNSNADWEERRAEILDLAQFYEYGYKPGTPDNMIIKTIVSTKIGDPISYWDWATWSMKTKPSDSAFDVVTMSITVGAVTSDLAFTIYYPTAEQLTASGHTGKMPVVLSYDGDMAEYRAAGFAVVSVPQGSDGDIRSTQYAWGTRTGTFYQLYPYGRNGTLGLHEVSSEMAAAWSATRVIDALEMMETSEFTGAADIADLIDPTQLAVTGFSISGKYAFVAAVFDDRIDVCIPGAAGASGPSPWRYVYMGHEYNWTGTAWAAPADNAAKNLQIATGTEVLANSIRHNRVRETETFRYFLTPGNFYKHLEGAYGFATRLPYDQSDLVATLAPRAIVLHNTVNDYNDGSEADSLGLQVAKSVYTTLGYDADDLIKFNQRAVQPTGDPHGSDPEQKNRTAEYLNYFFYDTAMSEETDTWLSTDPFNLKVSNNQTEPPYDYYYGGFNTITGGTGGASGTGGWYSYRFTAAVTPTATPTAGTNTSPQTGDPSASMLWILLGIAAIGILTSLIRKKRTDNASHH